jgi:hypothetical protein
MLLSFLFVRHAVARITIADTRDELKKKKKRIERNPKMNNSGIDMKRNVLLTIIAASSTA